MSVLTVIVDYRLCNLDSIARACAECGAEVRVTDDPVGLEEADRIILPGVGAFAEAMKNLTDLGWVEALNRTVIDKGIPFLGICLGMHLMAERGTEGRTSDGLGWIPGTVVPLSHVEGERLPHMGWNEVIQEQKNQLFTDIENSTDFYFVHGYHLKCKNVSDIICKTPYAHGFTSVVSRNNFSGVQFHPEKSQKRGFKLLENFLRN